MHVDVICYLFGQMHYYTHISQFILCGAQYDTVTHEASFSGSATTTRAAVEGRE
jgi:hypothetical protein